MDTSTHSRLTSEAAAKLIGIDPALEVVDVIERAGGEVRFVGGVVRDALLGRLPKKIKDIDMASTLPPVRATAALEAAGLHVIPTGFDHGTVTVRRRGSGPSGTIIELTTLRRDVKTDGRHAKVRFGTDWLEDAKRRDFTINSMSLSPDGGLYDPFGGARDLRAGRVRFVGDARERIQEDYLRILRFFRFYARFGKGRKPDQEAMDAITELSGGLENISGERIAKELFGILRQGKVRALWQMVHSGVDSRIFPRGSRPEFMGALFGVKGIETSPAFRLGFMITLKEDVGPVVDRLRLSKRDAGQVELGCLDLGDMGSSGHETAAWRRLPWRAGNPVPESLDGNGLACLYAANAIRYRREVEPGVISALLDWKAPVFPVSGGDLLGRGIPKGKRLGAELGKLRDSWVESDFKLDRDALLKQLDGTPAGG